MLAPQDTLKGALLLTEQPLLCTQTLDNWPLSLVCAHCSLPAGSLEEALALQTGGRRRSLEQAAAQSPAAAHWCEQRCGTAFCSEACRCLAAPAHSLLCAARDEGHPIRELHSAAKASSETLLLAAKLITAAVAEVLESDEPAAAAAATAAEALYEALGASAPADGAATGDGGPMAEAVEEAAELLQAGLHAQLAERGVPADALSPLLAPSLLAAAWRGLERGLLPLEMEPPLGPRVRLKALALTLTLTTDLNPHPHPHPNQSPTPRPSPARRGAPRSRRPRSGPCCRPCGGGTRCELCDENPRAGWRRRRRRRRQRRRRRR